MCHDPRRRLAETGFDAAFNVDAGCGYGRLARPLAERGATVVGVDQSSDLLAYVERMRGDIMPETETKSHCDGLWMLPELRDGSWVCSPASGSGAKMTIAPS